MIAARTGNPQVVRLLVEHGAKVDAVESRKGQDALMWAAAEGHAEAVEILLKAGAKPNTASKAGFSPLIFASENGDMKTAASLIAAGADVNYAVPAGMNALVMNTAVAFCGGADLRETLRVPLLRPADEPWFAWELSFAPAPPRLTSPRAPNFRLSISTAA